MGTRQVCHDRCAVRRRDAGAPVSPRRPARPFVVSTPLRAGQCVARRLLPPVRPGIGADDAAVRAHHAWFERRHGHVIRPAFGTQHRPVVANPAAHVERPHAVRPHVAERHRLYRLVDAPGYHPTIVGRPVAVGEGHARRSKDEAGTFRRENPARSGLPLSPILIAFSTGGWSGRPLLARSYVSVDEPLRGL
jgi:hypothetical protein